MMIEKKKEKKRKGTGKADAGVFILFCLFESN